MAGFSVNLSAIIFDPIANKTSGVKKLINNPDIGLSPGPGKTGVGFTGVPAIIVAAVGILTAVVGTA